MSAEIPGNRVESGQEDWPMLRGGRIFYSRLSREQAAVLLEQSYRLFVKVVAVRGLKDVPVPNTAKEETKFLNAIGAYAYGCGLCEVMRPRSDWMRGQLALAVPDLVFALIDRVHPDKFLASLEPSALDRWHDICRRRAMGTGSEIVRSFDAAVDVVTNRLATEAPLHASLDAFFEAERLSN
ncbi:hypothetical protein U8607_04160 [Methylobacterium durans]|uniref:hypothetical protein n=1 Tax=Methylobacterium durans TaxID=2202825 RepID=UPI002B002F7C|nr:hypothetical protein [Methylobacterium durans]MEA1831271.1 hypothetical protein [Methylobacterium durans]